MLRLYTFTISHFSEKARWALDYEGLAYQEKVLVPGPHQLVTRRIAPKSHVPLLDHDGRCVQDSSAILDYLADELGAGKLTPRDPASRRRVDEIEKRADRAFGIGVQRIAYWAMLEHRATVTKLWSARGPLWARAFFAVGYPAVARAVQRMYKTTDAEAVGAAKQLIVETFDAFDDVLAKQRYFGGDAPNRSDISMAALLAPLCTPPEHIVKWPALPAELADFVGPLRDRPTWSHTLRMYREHRRSACPS